MSPVLTAHAHVRMQQRGIRADVLEALLDFGSVAHAGHGCEIVYFDKAARARFVRREPQAARAVEGLARAYAIVGGDGTVVTVGKRYRRIWRC